MNDSHPFLPRTTLLELGPGAQVFMFGFRGSAMGQTKCCCLINTFKEVFGSEQGGPILSSMLELARYLGHEGDRKLKLAGPSCVRLTHDEASLLAAMNAEQLGDSSLRDAHLYWLLASPPKPSIKRILGELALAWERRGLTVTPPNRDYSATPNKKGMPRPTVSVVGHA